MNKLFLLVRCTAFRRNVLFLILVTLASTNLPAQQSQLPPPNYDEANAGTYTLPDPLRFNDGSPVRSADDWKRRRRAEVIELFAQHMYGRSPRPPQSLNYEVFDNDKTALGGKAIRKQVTIYYSAAKDGPKQEVLIYIPAAARKPVPVFLSISFPGNHTAANDPAVKLPVLWNSRTREKQQAAPETRGRNWEEVEKVLARGYAYATFHYQDIEPDFKGAYVHGIRPLFFKPGQTAPAEDDWGAIGAWGYGASRVMDYFEKDKDLDARRVALIGHSRLGKTAMWAGALDERFAMVISNCSGEGGASLMRRNFGETVRNLNANFPYWFSLNFQKYVDDVTKLPVDAHELIALIAPRPIYVTGAEEDQWADPKGEFLACVAAGPVYRLLGAQDLGTTEMPPLNQPIMRTIAFHYRTGKHAVTPYDWDQFLVFADRNLKPGR